jgi:phosphoenolpyruvate synthase/pyruvate phosphate dikinase
MPKTNWVKQLTRENTLLDRSLRTLAYAQSVPQVGRARMLKCPVIGQGKITSWYYDKSDYKRQQAIIDKELKGGSMEARGKKIIGLLESAYEWILQQEKIKFSKTQFPKYLKELQQYHAYGRGAIVYGYWGEPATVKKLKTALSRRVAAKDLDHTLSLLSAPKLIDGPLRQLYSPSPKVRKSKERLLAKLSLTKKELELVEKLSWLTMFYELGERVSSRLQDNLEFHLHRLIHNKKELNLLNWYDPARLSKYFAGIRLPVAEIARRQDFYVLMVKNAKLAVLSGPAAKKYFRATFPRETITNQTELKGTTASRGLARGPVTIVITQDDQKKMKPGDILVSTMTTPRLMTAVHRAAAIVTDEGGLTAHAAIVARELGIPCIVGTKIATQVLKDGDLVEVDATAGVVHKLKNRLK